MADDAAKLTEDEEAELIAAIGEIRKTNKNTKREIHGWRLEWATRPRGGASRGDLTAYAPDGGKYFSTAAVQRKLAGVVVEKPPPGGEVDAPGGGRVPRAVANLTSNLLDAPESEAGEGFGGRRMRARAVVNYAELNTVTPRMNDIILRVLARHAEGGAADDAAGRGVRLARWWTMRWTLR